MQRGRADLARALQQRAVGHGQRAAKLAGGRHVQHTGLHQQVAGIRAAVPGNVEHARARLAHVTAAGDRARQAQRCARCHVDAACLPRRQRDGAVRVETGRGRQHTAAQRQTAGGGAQVGVVRHRHGAQAHIGATGIGVVARQNKGAVIRLGQRAGAGQTRGDGPRHACPGSQARPHSDDAFTACALQRDVVTFNAVAVGCDLHAGDADGAGRRVDRDRAGLPLEHGKGGVGLKHAVQRAVQIGPVAAVGAPRARAAVDDAVVVAGAVAAVPETQRRAAGGCQVHLAAHGGLNAQVAGQYARRRGAQGQRVRGQRTAIVEQAIDAGAKSALVADVQRAGQSQVATHVKQRVR